MRRELNQAPVADATPTSHSSLEHSLQRASAGIYLRQVGALLWKDFLIELRTRDAVAAIMVFGIVALTVFNFAFELRAESVGLVAPGVLWVAILFAGTLGLGRSFSHERERGSMEGILLCPADRGTIFIAKFLANLVFITLAEMVIVPIYDSFLDVPTLRAGVVGVILLATVGFAAVGTVFGAMSVNTRAKEVMLPVLLLPVLVPLIIGAVRATTLLIDGQPFSEAQTWVNLLIVIDVVYLAISFIVFEFVVEDWG